MLRLFWLSMRSRIFTLNYFWDEKQHKELEALKKLYQHFSISMSLSEVHQLQNVTRETKKITGELAEVGVYKGGTAKVICMSRDKSKELHLFDTFGIGLPQPSQHDDNFWKKGSFALADEEVGAIKKLLADEPGVFFHPGIFPETATQVQDKRFSLVHLDVDIYQSTKDGLEFFYPRMNRGGIIISHDYHGSRGVQKAFEEFFADKPEPIVILPTSQCLVVKI